MLHFVMIIILVILLVVMIGLKLFSFRHVSTDDPTVSFYIGFSPILSNNICGELPLPEKELILFAHGENGVSLEELYLFAMKRAWLFAAAIAILIVVGLRSTF